MLGKLLKYEYSATARKFLPLFGAYLLVCLLLRISNALGDSKLIAFTILFIVITMAFTVLNFMMGLFPLVSSINRFNKNLLGDEGYLMNTLPVKASKLVMSKFIVAASWYILAFFAQIAGYLVMSVGDETFKELIDGFNAFFKGFTQALQENPGVVILSIVLVIISAFSAVLMIYASICIGHYANSGRGWKGVLAFIGMTTVIMMIVSTYFQGFESTLSHFDALDTIYFILWSLIGFTSVLGVVFYWITQHTLTKRLNLQ